MSTNKETKLTVIVKLISDVVEVDTASVDVTPQICVFAVFGYAAVLVVVFIVLFGVVISGSVVLTNTTDTIVAILVVLVVVVHIDAVAVFLAVRFSVVITIFDGFIVAVVRTISVIIAVIVMLVVIVVVIEIIHSTVVDFDIVTAGVIKTVVGVRRIKNKGRRVEDVEITTILIITPNKLTKLLNYPRTRQTHTPILTAIKK